VLGLSSGIFGYFGWEHCDTVEDLEELQENAPEKWSMEGRKIMYVIRVSEIGVKIFDSPITSLESMILPFPFYPSTLLLLISSLLTHPDSPLANLESSGEKAKHFTNLISLGSPSSVVLLSPH